MSNNGTGFWVIIGLIAALSFVALFEVAIATFGDVARRLARTLRRAITKRPVSGGRRLAA